MTSPQRIFKVFFCQRGSGRRGRGRSRNHQRYMQAVVVTYSYDPAGLVKKRPKTPKTRKNEETTKKNKIPYPGLAPPQKKMYIYIYIYTHKSGPKMTIFVFFVFFVFLGPNPGWEILQFCLFLGFFGFRGFLGSLPGPQDRNTTLQIWKSQLQNRQEFSSIAVSGSSIALSNRAVRIWVLFRPTFRAKSSGPC